VRVLTTSAAPPLPPIAQMTSDDRKIPLYVWLAPVAILALGLLRLPYGYYEFLRFAVCAAAALVAWQLFRSGGWGQLLAVAFVPLVLLYNPIFPVRLTRATWVPINVLTAGLFGVGALTTQLRTTSADREGGA